jgi:hypothetical protein
MKFALGRLVATPGAIMAAGNADDNLITYLNRHAVCDWGELSQDDRLANAQALKNGSRLLSAYHLKDGTKIWIVTEADRSATTVLLPDEY